jgi:uncharacterized protein YhbP (UPF0306 family)
MSLATVSGDKPWVCEVHFAYDDSLNLYFRSKLSTRHAQEIAKNSNVAGNIVRQHTIDEYPHAIYFEGTAELLDEAGAEAAFLFFDKRLATPATALEEALKDDGHKFFKITVNNWAAFGKFGEEKGSKSILTWNGGKK